jgi:hypothetical protein
MDLNFNKTKITINFIVSIKTKTLLKKIRGGEKRIQNYIAKENDQRERIDYLLDPKAKY